MGRATGEIDERTRRALDAQDWARLGAMLVGVARSRGRARSDAEDDAQQTIVKTYSTSPWDPDTPLVPHLLGILRSIIGNDRRSKRATTQVDGGDDFEGRVRDAAPDAEAQMIARVRHMRAEKRLAELLASVEGDELARQVVLAALDGVDKPKAQAEKLRAPIEDIRNARKRVWGHIDRILAATPDDSGPQSAPDAEARRASS